MDGMQRTFTVPEVTDGELVKASHYVVSKNKNNKTASMLLHMLGIKPCKECSHAF